MSVCCTFMYLYVLASILCWFLLNILYYYYILSFYIIIISFSFHNAFNIVDEMHLTCQHLVSQFIALHSLMIIRIIIYNYNGHFVDFWACLFVLFVHSFHNFDSSTHLRGLFFAIVSFFYYCYYSSSSFFRVNRRRRRKERKHRSVLLEKLSLVKWHQKETLDSKDSSKTTRNYKQFADCSAKYSDLLGNRFRTNSIWPILQSTPASCLFFCYSSAASCKHWSLILQSI